jgi:4-amino-4-deoxy-L-arabinose transferase-like glycosyltransferase
MAATSTKSGRASPAPVPRTPGRALTNAVRAVPVPLAAVVATVVVVGLFWALLVPPWQAPDEPSHFAYAQALAERFALPGNEHRLTFSSEQRLANLASGSGALEFRANQLRPDWSASDYARYRIEERRHPSRSDGGGPNPEAYDPPLFYLYSDLAYWATYDGTVFDRYYAMRIWGIGLLALTVIATWLLVGELLGRRRLSQLGGAAVVGLMPGVTFISTSVNPDALMIALWTLALWLGARVIKRAARPRDTICLLVVTAAAALTQPISYALAPAVLLAVILGPINARREGRPVRIGPAALAAVGCAAPVVAWIAARTHGTPGLAQIGAPPGQRPSPFSVRGFLSYVWQFYLPRLPWMIRVRVSPGLSVYNVWVREAWGTFGWLDVHMPSWVYTAIGSVTALIAVLSAGIVSTFRGRLRWQLVAFFGLACAALLLGLHLTEYRSLINDQGPFLQGRYLLPVVGLFGLAVALVLSRLPGRWRGPVCAAIVPGMLLLQVIALATVARTYYT